MKFLQKKFLLPAVAGMVLFILLPSCKSDPSKVCGPVEFNKENEVTIRMEAAATSLNPILPGPGYNRYAAANVIQSLGFVDPKTLELVPLLIKKIPQVYTVKDGPHKGMLAYDFEFYEAAKWDNGSPVTARDFLFSLNIIYHPQLPMGDWRGYFEYLQAVEVDPANPKKFTTYFSKYYILALESLCQFPIYPAYNYDPENQLAGIPLADLKNPERAEQLLKTNPGLTAWAEAFQSPRFSSDKNAISGSGPYRLENFDVDQGLVLVKKSNWWGDSLVAENPFLAAFPEKVVYRFVKEEAPTEGLIRSGAVDIVPAMSPTKFLELKKDSCLAQRYGFELIGANSYGRLMCNLRRPQLSDKRVRQALAYTIDYNYLTNTVWEGLAQQVASPVNPAKPFYARDLKPYDYNITKAKELLAAAGWADSNGNGILDKVINGALTELQIALLAPGTAPVSVQAAKSIQTTARNAGIAINIVEEDIRLISEQTRSGEYDMAITGASIFPGLVEFYQSFHSKSIGAGNRSGFSNAEMDQLIEAIRTEPDDAKRNVNYIKAQHVLHDELPEIFLYAPQQRLIVSKRFQYVLTANRPGYYEQFFRLIK